MPMRVHFAPTPRSSPETTPSDFGSSLTKERNPDYFNSINSSTEDQDVENVEFNVRISRRQSFGQRKIIPEDTLAPNNIIVRRRWSVVPVQPLKDLCINILMKNVIIIFLIIYFK